MFQTKEGLQAFKKITYFSNVTQYGTSWPSLQHKSWPMSQRPMSQRLCSKALRSMELCCVWRVEIEQFWMHAKYGIMKLKCLKGFYVYIDYILWRWIQFFNHRNRLCGPFFLSKNNWIAWNGKSTQFWDFNSLNRKPDFKLF